MPPLKSLVHLTNWPFRFTLFLRLRPSVRIFLAAYGLRRDHVRFRAFSQHATAKSAEWNLPVRVKHPASRTVKGGREFPPLLEHVAVIAVR